MGVILSEVNFKITEDIIQEVLDISKEAGAVIMEVYQTAFEVELKDDRSPVTLADKLANSLILERLIKIDPSIPILSEEGQTIPYAERKEWVRFWLIDPLDGTKDFIKKNGEFTVNIALVENQSPIFGVVYAPASDLLFWGSLENGAWKKEGHNPVQAMAVATQVDNTVQIAVSRSHPSRKMNKFIAQFVKYKLEPLGSSLKICRVADGTAHLYPRLSPTMEWDTAAAHAVLKSAGGEMIRVGTHSSLRYNKQDLLNPEFIAGKLSIIKSLDTFN